MVQNGHMASPGPLGRVSGVDNGPEWSPDGRRQWSRMVDNGPEWSTTMVHNGPKWSTMVQKNSKLFDFCEMVDDNGPQWSRMVDNEHDEWSTGARAVEQAPVHSDTLDALGEVGGLLDTVTI